ARPREHIENARVISCTYHLPHPTTEYINMAEMPTSKWRLALLALLAVSLACSDPLTVPQPSHVESVERVRPVSVPVNSAAEVIPNVIREAAAKRGGSVRALALGRVTTRELPDGRELQLQYVGGEDHQPRMLAVFLE